MVDAFIYNFSLFQLVLNLEYFLLGDTFAGRASLVGLRRSGSLIGAMRFSTNNHSLLDELNRAVATGNEQQRIKMLERITELFVAGSRGYSGNQIALFDDVLRELTTDIEVAARARLANRLAQLDQAPPNVIRLLACDQAIEVAEPVLKHSSKLCDADLIEIAASKGQKHLLAIAQRLKLNEPVTDVLVERGNRRVLRTVLNNKGARFSLAGYGRLTTRARGDRTLTMALGARGDLPRQFFLKLLEEASAGVRTKLERAHPHVAGEVKYAIDDVATGMQRETREFSREYTAATIDAKRRANMGAFGEANVHARAHAQEFERAVFALAQVGQFPVDLVERALLDKGEEMVLILAKAAGCSWTTAKELLLMYVAERDLRADDLMRAFERYRNLSENVARRVIGFYEARVSLRSQRTVQSQAQAGQSTDRVTKGANSGPPRKIAAVAS